jgi:hypothetical protein
MDGFNISRLYPNTRNNKVGLYPLGQWVPGITRSREPMVPQTYMRKSKSSSFMNRDTDSHATWLRDPLTGVWHKRSQAGGRDFLPSGAEVTMRVTFDPTEVLRGSGSAPSLSEQKSLAEMFTFTAADFGSAWGDKRTIADWRCSADKKMFDQRASGARVL